MDIRNKANRIRLLNFSTPQMRAFHLSWFAFHICFFGWFGIAPLTAPTCKSFPPNVLHAARCIFLCYSMVNVMSAAPS